MRHLLTLLLIFSLSITLITPVWGATDGNNQDDTKKIDTDDYIMFGVGGLAAAGLQEIYYREKPSVESRAPSIVMGYFNWNAIVVTKEMQIDDGEDRMRWEDILIANAGFTMGTLIWHYTVGKSVKMKPRKPHKSRSNYLKIGDTPTQIRIY